MVDLPYIRNHPLLAAILKRCAELGEEARALSAGSPERKRIEKRISKLEEYGLPKPDQRDLQRTAPILNERGKVIGETHSLRRRFKATRRGRPAEYTIRTRRA